MIFLISCWRLGGGGGSDMGSFAKLSYFQSQNTVLIVEIVIFDLGVLSHHPTNDEINFKKKSNDLPDQLLEARFLGLDRTLEEVSGFRLIFQVLTSFIFLPLLKLRSSFNFQPLHLSFLTSSVPNHQSVTDDFRVCWPQTYHVSLIFKLMILCIP